MNKAPRRHQGKEKGSTFILVLLALPLVFGSFGIAWDVMAYIWVRGETQASLDTAVAAGATQAATSSAGRLSLGGTDYANVIRQAYDINRPPFLACSSGVGSCWAAPNGAPVVSRDPKTKELQISWAITERYDTSWLSFLGIEEIPLTLESTAKLTSTTSR